jgi:hypothetical protein
MASNAPPGVMPVITTNYPPGGASLGTNAPPGAMPISMTTVQSGAIAALVDGVEDIEFTIAILSSYSAYHLEMTVASSKTKGPQGRKKSKVSTMVSTRPPKIHVRYSDDGYSWYR